MPARNRKDAAKQGKIRGFQEGDIIGVKKAARGNTGPEWLLHLSAPSACLVLRVKIGIEIECSA